MTIDIINDDCSRLSHVWPTAQFLPIFEKKWMTMQDRIRIEINVCPWWACAPNFLNCKFNAIGCICKTQHNNMYIWENHMHILRYLIQLKYYTDVHTYSYDKNVDII